MKDARVTEAPSAMDPIVLARLTGRLGDQATISKLCASLGDVFAEFLPDMLESELGFEVAVSYAGFETGRYGTLVSGLSKKGYGCGAWKNSEWGTYNRCSYDKTGCCVVVTTADGVTAINQQSADDTTALYEAIRAKLP